MSTSEHDVRILHRDEHLLVLDKPPTLATTSPEGGESLFGLARDLDPAAPHLHPLSRLDTQVSGIVTFARTKRANEVALSARHEGRMHRRYLALCTHAPSPSEGDWGESIAIDPRDPRKRRVVGPHEAAKGLKHALTHYCVLAESAPLVALHLFPRTGRTHQLRVHAAHAGSPLAGDTAYGGVKRITLANGRVLTASRVMLHCAEVRMPDPAHRARELIFVLDPPQDMVTLWERASGDALTLAARPSG
jgi:23S rRNA-/tRNA-specific pseudouridylate synthase